jgi:hypothetical protein
MRNKAPAVLEDQLGLRMLTKPVLGPTGHRVYFLGHHYNGTHECYDVGSARMDLRPIQIIRRHHKTKEEALVTWETLLGKLKEIENGKRPEADPYQIRGRKN